MTWWLLWSMACGPPSGAPGQAEVPPEAQEAADPQGAATPDDRGATEGAPDDDQGTGLTVHLTVDDLPWQIERRQEHSLSPDQILRWNQRLLAILRAHDVQASGFVNCVRLAPGDDRVLAAWRRDAHVLGNHTHGHLPANKVGTRAFLTDAASCQRQLTERLDTPPTTFRYPYLGYGADADQQQAIAEGLAELGLRNAPVTVPTSEWVFATRFRMALQAGDEALQEQIVAAWLDHMDRALQAADDLARATEGRPVVQTVLVHVNELNALHLDRLLARWAEAGVRFVDQSVALADPAYSAPVERIYPGALPWLARVHADAPEEVAHWFRREERAVTQAWPIELPGPAWPRGVPPVPADIDELGAWLHDEGFVGQVHGASWPSHGKGGAAPPADPGQPMRVARLVDATRVAGGFHYSYDLRCGPVALERMQALATWTSAEDGQGRPSVAFPLAEGACVATVNTEEHRPLLDEIVTLAGG